MKKIILFNLLFVASFGLSAQTSGQVATYTPGVGAYTDALYNYAKGSISESETKTTYENVKIKGSPYLSNIFQSADLYYGDESQGTTYFRYNAYNEEVEIKQQNLEAEPIRALGKDKKIRLIVNNKPMSFKTFVNKKGKTKNGYLTLLKDGKYKLYHHLGVSFREGKKAENSFVNEQPAKFSQYDEYYVEAESGKKNNQVEFSNNKVLELVAENDKENLKKFLKKNKLKIKTVNDLYQVIDFLNDLK